MLQLSNTSKQQGDQILKQTRLVSYSNEFKILYVFWYCELYWKLMIWLSWENYIFS